MKLQNGFALALLLVLILDLGSVSWASDFGTHELRRDPMREVRQCEKQCEKQQPYFEEHLCRQKCEQMAAQMDVNGNKGEGDAQVEYDRCQKQCPGSGKLQWQCQKVCHDAYEAALERERERGREHEHEHEHQHDEHDHGGRGGDERHPKERDYTQCLKECERKEEGFSRQRQCKLLCEDAFGRHRERHDEEGMTGRRKGYDDNGHKSKEKKESTKGKKESTKQKKESDNPYYFSSDSFETRYSTGEGHMKVLQRFSEKSKILLGIDNFRVGFYEANPNTFLLHHHWDADTVLFVISGNAIATFLKKENSETFNLEHGDVLMIPAGTTTHLVNSHNDEKLQIVELLIPINTPGRFEQFFGIGGKESKSFLNSFSTEILQAAFDLPKEQLQKLFNEQKGAIVKASQEQVLALAHKISARHFGQFKGGPFNLLDEQAQMSNQHGEFYEVTPNDYQMLEKLDVSVAYCDIKQNSMMAPHYNSRTTYVVMVEEGYGYSEIICPHLGSESNKKQDGSQKYEKIRSNLSKRDVFIIPAGHPVVLVASENENLRVIMFGINAQNNKRNFLAGQDNIMNQLDEEAKELSFNMPPREVEEMFEKQRQAHFMAAPQQQEENTVSIMGLAGF